VKSFVYFSMGKVGPVPEIDSPVGYPTVVNSHVIKSSIDPNLLYHSHRLPTPIHSLSSVFCTAATPTRQLKMADADFDAIKRAQQERNALAAGKGKSSKTFDPDTQRTDSSTKASLTDAMDTELYGSGRVDKFAGYNTSIAANDEDEDMDGVDGDNSNRLVGQYTATRAQMNEFAQGGTEEEDMLTSREKQAQIASRETDYQRRRFERTATMREKVTARLWRKEN